MHTYTGTCTHMYTCARAHKHTHTYTEQTGTQSTLCFTVVTAVSTHMYTHAHAHTCSYTHVHTHIHKEAGTRSTLCTFHGSDSSKRCPAIKAWSWRLCRRLCGCPSLWLLWEHVATLSTSLVCWRPMFSTGPVMGPECSAAWLLLPCRGHHQFMTTENLNCNQCWKN